MHYSMLTSTRRSPRQYGEEFMELIENEWKNGSKSTWIEIVAAPIGYVMKELRRASSSRGRQPRR